MPFKWNEVHENLYKPLAKCVQKAQFQAFKATQPVLNFDSVDVMLEQLHSNAIDPDMKNQILTALVEIYQMEPRNLDLAMQCLILALWPGLTAIRRRMRRVHRSDPETVDGDILARVVEGITQLDLARVNWVAATLLRNIERDMMRQVSRNACLHDEMPNDEIADPDAGGEVARLLVLRDLNSVLGRDAPLIIAVDVVGLTQKEAAQALGLTYEGTRKRYQRAKVRLMSDYFYPN